MAGELADRFPYRVISDDFFFFFFFLPVSLQNPLWQIVKEMKRTSHALSQFSLKFW